MYISLYINTLFFFKSAYLSYYLQLIEFKLSVFKKKIYNIVHETNFIRIVFYNIK